MPTSSICRQARHVLCSGMGCDCDCHRTHVHSRASDGAQMFTTPRLSEPMRVDDIVTIGNAMIRLGMSVVQAVTALERSVIPTRGTAAEQGVTVMATHTPSTDTYRITVDLSATLGFDISSIEQTAVNAIYAAIHRERLRSSRARTREILTGASSPHCSHQDDRHDQCTCDATCSCRLDDPSQRLGSLPALTCEDRCLCGHWGGFHETRTPHSCIHCNCQQWVSRRMHAAAQRASGMDALRASAKQITGQRAIHLREES